MNSMTRSAKKCEIYLDFAGIMFIEIQVSCYQFQSDFIESFLFPFETNGIKLAKGIAH